MTGVGAQDGSEDIQAEHLRLRAVLAKYQQPSPARAMWQIANTLVPYGIVWYAMYLLTEVSLWLTMPLAVIAGALLVRVFIIFHDCGHGSFFRSRWANELTGFLAGVLTFTPFHQWHREHAIHHGNSGRLDRRGTGDIWTLTVQEYLDATRWKRLCYRLARNPVVLLVLAPLTIFVFVQRVPSRGAPRRARHSVWWMNLALLGAVSGMSWLFGAVDYLVIQLVTLMVAGAAGIWLFYVQHQFEGVYWERGSVWNPVAAALQGSSYYKLPRLLQWFTGNIGFHHIHHLGPGIPNYHLQACHESDAAFQRIRPVTLRSSLGSMALRLWDESQGRLVGYDSVAQRRSRLCAGVQTRGQQMRQPASPSRRRTAP